MAVVLSLTEAQTLAALRTVLLALVPAGVEIIRAEINRIPEPQGNSFIIMTPILRNRLATNTDSYFDGYFSTPPVPGTTSALAPTQVTVQLDIHGPTSADNAQIISTLLRDDYACQAFLATGYDVQPLYAGDPRQSVFLDAEQQQEMRWTVDAVLQANPIITTPQGFASVVTTGVIEVDAAYPPAG